jgi:hypothetical protein
MAKRFVDKRKTRKALRKLRRVVERATEAGGPGLTAWEKDFVEGVSGRLEKYGSAFRDPGKGRLEDALSQRQAHVARVLGKKSRKAKADTPEKDAGNGLRRTTLKRKTPLRSRPRPRTRNIDEDRGNAPENQPEPQATPAARRAALRVIPGGKGG